MKNKALNHKQIEKARALATHQERLDDQKELDVDLLAHVTGGTGTKMRKEKDYEKSSEEKSRGDQQREGW